MPDLDILTVSVSYVKYEPNRWPWRGQDWYVSGTVKYGEEVQHLYGFGRTLEKAIDDLIRKIHYDSKLKKKVTAYYKQPLLHKAAEHVRT